MDYYIECAWHTTVFQFFPFFFRSSMKVKLGYRGLKSWCLNLLLYAPDSLGEARDKEIRKACLQDLLRKRIGWVNICG